MGYPMTFQRVINRNGLADGDYDKAPLAHQIGVNMRPSDDGINAVAGVRRQRLEGYEQAFRMIAGDLRRLENDAVDEQSICAYIAARIGVEKDTVAAVLKEFIAW